MNDPVTALDPDRFLGVVELSAILGFSQRTLHRWRKAGSGPPYHRVGNRVQYRWREVQAWVDACRARRVSGASRQGKPSLCAID